MSLQSTVSADRIHIAFFGRRNAGKSSVVNRVANQELALVSETKGTTTDPVYKAMELLPLGPVMLIDTAGIDDEGDLGEARVKKTMQVMNKTDFAVLVIDATVGIAAEEEALIKSFEEKKIPYLLVYNKSDLALPSSDGENTVSVSALQGTGIKELKEKIASLAKDTENKRRIIGDRIAPNDTVVLVAPIDEAAPKGRLILPQQQVLRDVLDAHAAAVVVQDTELSKALANLKDAPSMVITDSQAFASVSKDTPEDIPLTSFSILMARYKGTLAQAVGGAVALNSIQEGDKILISEGCTHHRQCNDIGTVKLPGMIQKFTGKNPEFCFSSGREFPEDLNSYALIIHCGGCMLNEREMQYRSKCASDAGIPMTNYGICIAYMQGILKRSIALFPDILALLETEK